MRTRSFNQKTRCRVTGTLFILSLLGLQTGTAGEVIAQWSQPLDSGGELRIDPHSNRASIYRNGVETQAWDGVHRLRDGRAITIHSGIAVPDTGILDARRPPPVKPPDYAHRWEGIVIIGESPCEQLVLAVCGRLGECDDAQACGPARQLLSMESRERASARSPRYMTFTSAQCQEAAADTGFFSSCLPRHSSPEQGD